MDRVELGLPGGIMPPFDKVLQLAQRGEAKGYDAVWWPCHLMGWHPQSIWIPEITELARYQKNPDTYFEPIAMMGAVGAHTKRIRIGLGVTDVIRRHPAMLAQAILTLDHITHGRIILGLGSGEQCNVIPYGLDFSKPVSRLEEGLKIIRRLWESGGKPVDFDGKFWKLESAVLGLEPYEGKCPPIWVASHGPRMLRLTGQYADGWLPTMMSVDEYRDKLQAIRQAAVEAGRDPDAITPGLLAYVIIDENRDVIPKLMDSILVKGLCLLLPATIFKRLGCEPPFGEEVVGFHDYIPSRFGYEDSVRVMNRVPREVVDYFTLHGTPEDVAVHIQTLVEAGLRHVVLWNITPFADMSRARSSFDCLDRLKEILS